MPERLDLQDRDAELVLDGAADRFATAPTDVQVRAATPPVADREDLVGGEPAEGQQRQGHPDGHRDQPPNSTTMAQCANR